MVDLKKFSLKNKNALITGAGGLLGYEHCAALLELGASVWMLDINEDKLLQTKSNLVKCFPEENINIKVLNITDEKSLNILSNSLDYNSIRIDILVNNAAIDPKITNKIEDCETSRLENFSLDNWNNQINVGLTGTFLCCKIFGYKMSIDQKGGIILNIASDLSVIAPDNRIYRIDNADEKNQPVKPVSYSVIKTGLIGLTRYLSTYWAKQNVRCNALSPGGVFNSQDPKFVTRLENLIPMERMAKKDEYRSSIQFLCSEASSYMTGQNIIIDGGRSVL